MKVYIFYLLKYQSGRLYDVPRFFGRTISKRIKNDFITQRDMDLFFYKEKEIKEEFFDEFKLRFKHKELTYNKLYTRSSIIPTNKSTIFVLTTWEEFNSSVLKVDMIFDELMKYASTSIYKLKKEYIDALNLLNYLDTCRFAWASKHMGNLSYMFDGILSNSKNAKDNLGIVESNIDYDEFALYMVFHGYTYK